MNAYTVIYISPTSGLINLAEVEADNAMAAFTIVAKTYRNEPKEFVAVVEGHNLEGETLHFLGDSMRMNRYTVWVTNFSVTARDTIFITSVEAANEGQAMVWAIEECADAWEEDIFNLVILGVAEGVVNILQWDDNGITYTEATA